MEKLIGFTKVALPYGWLGNMSPYPITYENKEWRTSEALFQALRYTDDDIIEEIRRQKSPMGAKMVAKKYRDCMVVEPLSNADLANMQMCLRLKLEQNPELINMLIDTGNATLYEDVRARTRGNNLYWGAVEVDGELDGINKLGKMWMDLRAVELIKLFNNTNTN